MKQANNNEIDTLLRNLARRKGTTPAAAESVAGDFASAGAHLDTDELSSYAEQALPPSARARCTAHLADCVDCRKIVAQLSMAAGPLPERGEAHDEPVAGSTWLQKFAGLFTPRVLSYSLPALVLVIVAVAFFNLRQQRNRDYIALNERAQPAPALSSSDRATSADAPAEKNDPAAQPSTRGLQKENPQSTPATPAAGETAKSEAPIVEEKKFGDVASTTAPAKAGKADAAAADKAPEKQAAYAPEPAPPAPAKSQSQVGGNAGNNAAVNQEQQKDLARGNVADERERGRDVNVQRKGPARNDNEVNQRGPAKREAQPAAAKMKAAETAAAPGSRAEDDDAETKTVFGRRFRRQGNAWVDTAYTSSMSIRSVTRGTEEYRALVADEPVIGGIGKQLSGEVIVVWKGHAYRLN